MANEERKIRKNTKYSTRFDIVECATCSVPFGVPTHFEGRRRQDGSAFHCPNGHGNIYKVTSKEDLQKKIDALTKERDELKTEVLQLKHKLEQAGIS